MIEEAFYLSPQFGALSWKYFGMKQGAREALEEVLLHYRNHSLLKSNP